LFWGGGGNDMHTYSYNVFIFCFGRFMQRQYPFCQRGKEANASRINEGLGHFALRRHNSNQRCNKALQMKKSECGVYGVVNERVIPGISTRGEALHIVWWKVELPWGLQLLVPNRSRPTMWVKVTTKEVKRWRTHYVALKDNLGGIEQVLWKEVGYVTRVLWIFSDIYFYLCYVANHRTDIMISIRDREMRWGRELQMIDFGCWSQ